MDPAGGMAQSGSALRERRAACASTTCAPVARGYVVSRRQARHAWAHRERGSGMRLKAFASPCPKCLRLRVCGLLSPQVLEKTRRHMWNRPSGYTDGPAESGCNVAVKPNRPPWPAAISASHSCSLAIARFSVVKPWTVTCLWPTSLELHPYRVEWMFHWRTTPL